VKLFFKNKNKNYLKMCYRFEPHRFQDGLFKQIDATFIIHLEGNGRLKQVKEQLDKIHPTNLVYILHNKGYKKCSKTDISTPPIDLVDAFLQCLKFAETHGMQNVLILEDDFQFHKDTSDHSLKVDNFLSIHTNESFLYYLGTVPYLQYPVGENTYRILMATGTHACVYTPLLRKELLLKPQEEIKDWDVYMNFNAVRYAYYKPLCIQLFPETENQQHWMYGGSTILKTIFKALGMDKQAEPGYTIFYIFSKIFFFAIILFLIWILIK
jgi:hypothetical protein